MTYRSKAFERRVCRALSRREIPHRDLAAALDRSDSYVSRALRPDAEDYRLAVSDLPALAELLGRDDIAACLDTVLEAAGLRCTPLSPTDPTPIDRALLELDVALGHVKEAYLDAQTTTSPGGGKIVRLERVQLAERVRPVVARAEDLLASLTGGGL